MDFAGGHDFALYSSHLVLTLHVVPEFGTSKNLVACEHSHSEQLRVGILLSGESSTDPVVLSDLKTRKVRLRKFRTVLTLDATPTPLTILDNKEINNNLTHTPLILTIKVY